MVGLARLLDDSLPLLIGVTTALLLGGCGLMLLTRSPAHRQRTGELTLAAILGWLALACLPLPRLLPADLLSGRFGASMPVSDVLTTSFDDIPATLPPPTGAEPATIIAGDVADSTVTFSDPSSRNEIASSYSRAVESVPRFDERVVDRPVASASAPKALSRLTLAYLGGVAACIFWLACGRLWLARIRRSSVQPAGWLADLFESLLAQAGSHPRPLLLVSRRCARPISWGTWRPVVVLPLALVRRHHRDALRMVLLHELAHVARRDSRGNLLLCMALPLLYAHPLFWWLRGQVRLAAELVADEWAAQQTGKLAYIEQLVAVARRSPAGLIPVTGAVSLYSSPSQFYRRMQMLLARENALSIDPSDRWRRSSVMAAGLAVVVAAAAVGARPAAGQPAPEGAAAADPTTQASKPEEQPAEEQTREVVRQTLRAKLAAAQQQIRAIEAEVSALQADEKGAEPSATPAAETPRQPRKTIMLTRVNEDGSISNEEWSADDDGRPQKLLKKLTPTADSPISAARPAALREVQVVRDGKVVRQVYDADTGRLIETRTGPTPKDEFRRAGNAASESSADVRDGVIVTRRAPDKSQAPTGDHDRGSSAGLDLVSLATAYADSVGNVDTAKAQLAAEEAVAANKAGSQRDLEAARVALRNAQRKHQLLRNIAAVAAESAKGELQRVQQLVRAGAAPATFAAEADARAKILKEILRAETADNAQGRPSAPLRAE